MNPHTHRLTQSLSPTPADLFEFGVSRVTDSLFFSGALGSKAYRRLNALGITVFVNLQAERQEIFKNVHVDGYLWVPVPDHSAPSLTQLGLVVGFLSEVVQHKRKCLVSCRMGVGRSALACAAYLVAHHGISVAEATSILQEIRPVVRLSESQQARLTEFARTVEPASSAATAASPPQV